MMVVNQYGDTVAIFGSGIYSGDTYFKAPISIGTDFCMLFMVVPLLSWLYLKKENSDPNRARINLIALYGVAFYYAASIAFGLKYNQLHLVYIALFGCSLFGVFKVFRELDLKIIECRLTKGLRAFLVLSGIVLMIAWLPDIILTILSGRPSAMIGIYTTEATNVLDMGIIAPLCFVCLYLLAKKDPLGTVILAAILKLCYIIGIMMVAQTAFQHFAGIDLSLPVLITKTASFLVLGGFAFYFERKLYADLAVSSM